MVCPHFCLSSCSAHTWINQAAWLWRRFAGVSYFNISKLNSLNVQSLFVYIFFIIQPLVCEWGSDGWMWGKCKALWWPLKALYKCSPFTICFLTITCPLFADPFFSSSTWSSEMNDNANVYRLQTHSYFQVTLRRHYEYNCCPQMVIWTKINLCL